MKVVSNAGPLIALAKIERFHALRAAGYHIGDAVYREILDDTGAPPSL